MPLRQQLYGWINVHEEENSLARTTTQPSCLAVAELISAIPDWHETIVPRRCCCGCDVCIEKLYLYSFAELLFERDETPSLGEMLRILVAILTVRYCVDLVPSQNILAHCRLLSLVRVTCFRQWLPAKMSLCFTLFSQHPHANDPQASNSMFIPIHTIVSG